MVFSFASCLILHWPFFVMNRGTLGFLLSSFCSNILPFWLVKPCLPSRAFLKLKCQFWKLWKNFKGVTVNFLKLAIWLKILPKTWFISAVILKSLVPSGQSKRVKVDGRAKVTFGFQDRPLSQFYRSFYTKHWAKMDDFTDKMDIFTSQMYILVVLIDISTVKLFIFIFKLKFLLKNLLLFLAKKHSKIYVFMIQVYLFELISIDIWLIWSFFI